MRTWESANAHHSQLPAIPRRATSPVTYSGVSTLKVVAAIEVPTSHQGSAREPAKKASRLRAPRRESHSPMTRVRAP